MGAVSGQLKPSCVLCARINERLLWENDRFRVIAVQEPDYPGYVRIIANQHVAEMTDLPERDQAEIMRLVLKTERLMRKAVSPDKINLASLGNQVPHLHWHVIPRWINDPCFPGSIWSPKNLDQTQLALPDGEQQRKIRQAQEQRLARAQAFWLALGQDLA